jgi:hypothetical protein
VLFDWSQLILQVQQYIIQFVQLNLLAIFKLFGLFVVVSWVFNAVQGSLGFLGKGPERVDSRRDVRQVFDAIEEAEFGDKLRYFEAQESYKKRVRRYQDHLDRNG